MPGIRPAWRYRVPRRLIYCLASDYLLFVIPFMLFEIINRCSRCSYRKIIILLQALAQIPAMYRDMACILMKNKALF